MSRREWDNKKLSGRENSSESEKKKAGKKCPDFNVNLNHGVPTLKNVLKKKKNWFLLNFFLAGP